MQSKGNNSDLQKTEAETKVVQASSKDKDQGEADSKAGNQSQDEGMPRSKLKNPMFQGPMFQGTMFNGLR